jgi:hypothetical protein
MSESVSPRLLQRAAETAAARPAFLGWALDRFRQAEGLDDAGLARWLGTDPSRLQWLGLCQRPRPDRFAADVAALSARFSVDPSRLAAAIRQVDALSALAHAPAQERGMLAAARDREDDGTDPGEDVP